MLPTAVKAQSNISQDRRNAILASLILGLFSLFIVPIYFAFNPIDAAGIRAIDGFAIGNVVLFAGESPAGVFLGLILFPLLIRWGNRVALWVTIALGLLLGLGQVGSIFFAVTDRTMPIWAVSPSCTLITCGLYHSLFHLFQVLPSLAVAWFNWRLTRAVQEKSQ